MSKWEERVERETGRFEDRPVRTSTKWIAIIGIVIVLIAIIAFTGRFACGWGKTVANTASPENVSLQYRQVIEGYEALQATAGNVCDAANMKQKNDSVFLESPEFTYRANYRKIAVDYNRRMSNFFEAKNFHPKGYPAQAPSLDEMLDEICPSRK